MHRLPPLTDCFLELGGNGPQLFVLVDDPLGLWLVERRRRPVFGSIGSRCGSRVSSRRERWLAFDPPGSLTDSRNGRLHLCAALR